MNNTENLTSYRLWQTQQQSDSGRLLDILTPKFHFGTIIYKMHIHTFEVTTYVRLSITVLFEIANLLAWDSKVARGSLLDKSINEQMNEQMQCKAVDPKWEILQWYHLKK